MSNRRFIVAYVDQKNSYGYPCSLNYILTQEDSDSEDVYAMRENIDAILDLKVGEYLMMQFNRDTEVPGIIRRTA